MQLIVHAVGHTLSELLPAALQVWSLGQHTHVLMANMHHIILDGLSSELLQRELAMAYAAARAGRSPIWQPLPVTCAFDVVCCMRLSTSG